MPTSLVTLDPKVLIAVEANSPRATAALRFLSRLGYAPQVTPIVLSALGKMLESGENAIERMLAFETMQGMAGSRYDLAEFSSTEKVIVSEHAKRLHSSNAIPGGTMADARLVVEASYRDGKAALLTRRNPILEANRAILDVTLEDCGLGGSSSLKIYSPEILVQYEARTLKNSPA